MANEEDETYSMINKEYAESNLYELSEALTILSKSISKTSQENKELISSHFSKFVECRATLEDIYDDVKAKNLNRKLTGEIEKVIGMLLKKYEALSIRIREDIRQETFNNRRLYYENEFVDIFTLKANLSKNLNNFENFVNLYKRAQKIYEPYKKSQFLTKKIEDVQPEINIFLENVYSYISSERLNFEESCYYFDLYFDVSQEKSDRKIMNTLLVTFKECTYIYDDMENVDGYLNYLEMSLLKFIGYVDDDLKKNGIEHYFKSIAQAVKTTAAAKTAFKRAVKVSEVLEVSPAVTAHFKVKMSEAKADAFFNLLKNGDEDGEDEEKNAAVFEYFVTEEETASATVNRLLEKSTRIFVSYKEIIKENELSNIQDILIDHIKASVEEQSFGTYDFFRLQITDVRKCLGSRKSPKNRILDRFLREKREKTVLRLSNELEKTVVNAKSGEDKTNKVVAVFMHILHLLDKTSKESLKDILFEAKQQIMNDQVTFYFLHKFIRMREPDLDKANREVATRIHDQFKCLKDEIYQ